MRQKDMDITREILYPVVLKGQIDGWPAKSWSPHSLAEDLVDMELQFRVGPKSLYKEVIWEGDCKYIEATLQDFIEWTDNQNISENNPLFKIDHENYWLYADYKYMATQFKDKPSMISAVDWSVFGLEGRDGTQSTFWLGSVGAHTPCHQDSYGCNLVAQIYGRKRWILFPPSDRNCLYPTRIPYEESSVFSQVNLAMPDLQKHSKLKDASPYMVILEPGDVLYVPHHWWHFVESLETSISINSWLELPCDHEMRVQEALTRTVMCSLMSTFSPEDTSWLNPTEELSTPDMNLNYISQASQVFMQHNLSQPQSKTRKRGKIDICEQGAAQTSLSDSSGVICVDDPGPCRKKRTPNESLQTVTEVNSDGESGDNKTKLSEPASTSRHQVSVRLSCHKANSDLTVKISLKDGQSMNDVIIPVSSYEVEKLVQKSENPKCSDLSEFKQESVVVPDVSAPFVAQCFSHPDIIECVTKILLNKFQS